MKKPVGGGLDFRPADVVVRRSRDSTRQPFIRRHA